MRFLGAAGFAKHPLPFSSRRQVKICSVIVSKRGDGKEVVAGSGEEGQVRSKKGSVPREDQSTYPRLLKRAMKKGPCRAEGLEA